MNSLSNETAQLAGGLAIGGAVVAAFLIGGNVTSALISGALVIGFVLLVHFGRRRSQSTLSTLCAIFALTWAGAAIVLPRRS